MHFYALSGVSDYRSGVFTVLFSIYRLPEVQEDQAPLYTEREQQVYMHNLHDEAHF